MATPTDGTQSGSLTPNRRDVLRAAGAIAIAGSTGEAVAQQAPATTEDDSVNVEEVQTIVDAENIHFDSNIPIGHINGLFIAFDSARHPIIGNRVGFPARVLNRVSGDDVRAAIDDNHDWNDFLSRGNEILAPLFGAFSWVPEDDTDVVADFYESHDLLRLVGVSDADQRFYDRYGYVPKLWAVVPKGQTAEPGTTVEAAGTVRYAGTGSDDDGSVSNDDRAGQAGSTPSSPAPTSFSGGSGVYLELDNVYLRGGESTLPDAAPGGSARMAGLQYSGSPTLSTDLWDVEYAYQGDYPRPEGGSLVEHQGTVESISAEDTGGTASMETTSQRIVVGDTRPGSWDQSDEDDGDEDEGPTNTVAVLDVSGSMSDTDTRSGDSRISIAKQSARQLANFVGEGNRLGVVSFSVNASTDYALSAVDSSTREEMIDAIDRLSTFGDTSIGAGLEAALEELRGTQGPKSIILLSDGEHNTPPSPSSVLPDLKSLGVTIYTIGMGSTADLDLLQQLANQTGGEMRYRVNPGEIRALFQQFSSSTQNRATLYSEEFEMEEGDEVESSATVDGSCDTCQFSLSYPGSKITLTPIRPDGSELDESEVTHRVGETSEIWEVEDPPTGEWGVTVKGEQLDRPENANVEVSADSPIRASLFITDHFYEQTGMLRIELKIVDGRERYTDADVSLTASLTDNTQGQKQEVSPLIDQTMETIELRDDRGGPDPVADDGIYTGYFHPTQSGTYEFTAQISGGRVGDLERNFTRKLTIPTVVDNPIRPYKMREPIEESASLLDQYGIYALGGAAGVGLLAGAKRYLGGD